MCLSPRRWRRRGPERSGSAPGARSRSRSAPSTGSTAPRPGSPVAGARSGRGPRAAETSGERALRDGPPQLGHRLGGVLERDGASVAPAAHLDLQLAALQRTAPDRDPQRAAQELRVGELLARPGITVVEEDVEAGFTQLVVEPLGDLALVAALLAQPDQLDVERGQRAGPRDALLVGELLHRRRGDPRRTDSVGAHPHELLLAVLVQIGRSHRLGVARPELEDVAHLDRGFDTDRVSAHDVALLDATHVGALEGEVAARLHAAQVA